MQQSETKELKINKDKNVQTLFRALSRNNTL